MCNVIVIPSFAWNWKAYLSMLSPLITIGSLLHQLCRPELVLYPCLLLQLDYFEHACGDFYSKMNDMIHISNPTYWQLYILNCFTFLLERM